MTFEELQQKDAAVLAAYTWRRLRMEEPLDPPVERRFRHEPPEEFLVVAADELDDDAFCKRLILALCENLIRLAVWMEPFIVNWRQVFDNAVTNQQIASIAFLISALENDTPLSLLRVFVTAEWLREYSLRDPDVTGGQFHIMRTLTFARSGWDLPNGAVVDGPDEIAATLAEINEGGF